MKRKLLFYYRNSKSVLLTLLFSSILITSANAQINIAPSATPSAAPGCSTGPCSTLNDLSFGTCGTQQMWISCNATNPGSAVNITFTWPTRQSIKGLTIHVGEQNNRFLTGGTVQKLENGNWVNVIAFTQSNLAVCSYNIDFPATVNTRELRIIDLTVGGAQSSNANFREIEIWQGTTGDNDIGAIAIDSPATFCSGAQNIWATIANLGTNQVNSFTVNWSIDGITQLPISSSAFLDTMGGAAASTLKLQLGTHTFTPNVLTEIKVWTSLPNNAIDTSRLNDTASILKIPGLNGNYTIGGAGATFPDMVTTALALRTGGICGPVHFTVNPGTYTGQVELRNISGVSSTNTITFEGVDKSTCIVDFTTPAASTNHAVLIIDNTPFVTVRNLSITNNGTTAGFGIVIQNGSHFTKIRNCIVSVMPGTSTAFAGIAISGSRTSATTVTRGDYIEIDSNIVNNGYYAIVNYGGSGVNINFGLRVTHNVVNNYTNSGIYCYYNNGIAIEDNFVKGSPVNQVSNGIYISQLNSSVGYPNRIVRNRLTNIGYYGLYIASGSNTAGEKGVIINNFIGGSGSPATYYGIYMGTCNSWRVLHNTVLQNRMSSTLSYVPAYFSSGTGNAVMNNIFRTESMGATFYGSAATVFDTLDYNIYSRTARGANYFYLGAYYTDSLYINVGGFNNNSLTVNPRLLNDSILTPGNPCITGTPLANITHDYFNTLRNGTNPTIGAAEYLRYADEIMIESVRKPVAPVSSGLQDVEIVVKNSGTTTLTAFAVNFTDNNGFPVTQYWAGSLAPCDTTTVTISGQLNLVTSHDLVFYTSLPNYMNDPNTSNDTIRLHVELPLNGTYTIGASPADFPTPQAAAAALKNSGITGPVNFVFNPGTYTGQLRIEGPIPGNIPANPITFDGVDAATRVIDANISQAAVLITNTSYITIKNLTINNTASTTFTAGISLVGTFYDKTGTSSTIKHNIINIPNTGANTSYGINVTGTTNGMGQSNNNLDSITIDSNTVTGGYYGISLYGNTGASALNNRLPRLRGNTVNKAYSMGIYLYYIYNPIELTANTVSMDTTHTSTSYGIYSYYCLNSSTLPHIFTNNRVINANYMGIYLYNFASPSTAPMQVYNNIVTGVSRYSSYYGIYTYGSAASANINCYHNTVIANTAAPAPPSLYPLYYSNLGTIKNFKNNILVINTTKGSPNSTPLYLGNAVTGNSVNHNTYVNLSNSNMVYYNVTNYNTTNYRVANIGGDSSMNVNPEFVNPLNPTLTEGCLRGVNLTAQVPADINGITRSTSPNLGAIEFIGTSNDLSMEAVVAPALPASAGLQDLVVRVRNNGSNIVTSFNVAYTVNSGTPVVYTWTGSLSPCSSTNITFNGASQINITSSANQVSVYSYLPNGVPDASQINDTLNLTIAPALSGSYTIGSAPSDFATFTEAVQALNRGISGPVRFNVKSGVYNEALYFEGVTGVSATNTITFTSQANHTDSVRLTWASTPLVPYVVRLGGLSRYIVFERITISQLSNTGTFYGIQLLGSASFDTIRNCKITSPAYLSNTTYNIYANAYNGEGLAINQNRISGAYYGIYLNGGSRTAGFKRAVVNANTIDSFYGGPINYFQYSVGSAVTNNVFHTPAGAAAYMYMYFYYNDSGFKNTGNIFNTRAGKIAYWYNYYSNNSASNRSFIANNQIKGDGLNYFYVGNTTNNQEIVHNNFTMGAGYFYVSLATSTMRVLNNVMNSTGTYAYYFSGTPTTTNVTTDHNLVYTSGSATPYYANAAGRSASFFRTTYAPLESRSVYYRPALPAGTPDLNDSACWVQNGMGTFLGYASNDVNGNPRPQTRIQGAPDIGAFEFTPPAATLPPALEAVPAVPVAGQTQAFLLGLDTVAKITWDGSATPPTELKARMYSGAYPPGISGNTSKSLNMYWSFEAPSGGYYLYNVSLFFRPTLRGSIDDALNLIGSKLAPTFAWTPYYAPQSVVDSVAGILTVNSLYDYSGFIFAGTDAISPLPVKLSQFGAVAEQTHVKVNWTTASEKNAAYFEVYSSADGKDFRPVSGRIAANGNTTTVSHYGFTDINALASANVLYYKLRIVDRDGSHAWSEVAIVKNNRTKASAFEVYPNPFNNSLAVSTPDNGNVLIQISSVQGEKIHEYLVNAENGKAVLNDLGQLKPGVYFIRLSQNGSVSVEKIIKQ